MRLGRAVCGMLVALAGTAHGQVLSLLDFEGQTDGVALTTISENGNFWFPFATDPAQLPVGSTQQPDPETRPDGAAASTLSADFGPGGGYLEADTGGFALPDGGWTIETRARFNAVGGFQTMFGRDKDIADSRTSFADLYFQKRSNDTFSCSFVTGFTDDGMGGVTVDRVFVETTQALQANVWYHLAAVYDDAADELRLYVNGELDGVVEATANIQPAADPFSQFWSVGRGSFGDAAGDFFNGQLDDFRITGSVLSPGQFLYEAPCPEDLNDDGTLSDADVTMFLNMAAAGCDLPPLHTYVDASFGSNTGPASAASGEAAEDGLWGLRTGVANGGTVYEASGVTSGQEDAPEISTTISGLTPGEDYLVYVHFWDAANDSAQNWSIRAGFTSGDLTLFGNAYDGGGANLGATLAAYSSVYNYANPPLFAESNRQMLAGRVGVATADASGEITVYIDDLPSAAASGQRTWYDGLSYLPYEPSDTYTYVDADAATNTGPGSAFSGATAEEDGLWGERLLGSGGLVYEGSGVASGIEDVPEISTTLTGLTPGAEYHVWVNFWDPFNDANQTWPIRAGYTSGALTLFAGPDGGAELVGGEQAAFASDLIYNGSEPLLYEGNRANMAGYLGPITASAGGEITVYVDDLPSPIGANQRTWYDGLTYGPAPAGDCPADWDGNGVVDFFDTLSYLSDYDEGCQ